MRPLFVFVALFSLAGAAYAVPLEPRRGEPAPLVRPRLFSSELAAALVRKGCMPAVDGAWAFDARDHKVQNWRPVPPAGVEACVAQVIQQFPPDLTGATLVWPPRDH